MKMSVYRGYGLSHPVSTVFIASIGKCGQTNYRELQCYYFEGDFNAIITDGYKYLTGVRFCKTLKDAIKFFEECK